MVDGGSGGGGEAAGPDLGRTGQATRGRSTSLAWLQKKKGDKGQILVFVPKIKENQEIEG